MELFSLLLLILLPLLLIAVVFIKKPAAAQSNLALPLPLPPGSSGLPLIGETLDLIRAMNGGDLNIFIMERIRKYGSQTFITCLLGEKMVVMCGAAANKFIFSNEGTKVEVWWSTTVQRLLGRCFITKFGEEGRAEKKRLMMEFFNTDNLVRWVSTVDLFTRRHISSHWEGKEEVKVFPTVELFTFEVVCRLVMSITDTKLLSKLAIQFNIFFKGIMSLPLNFPGTRFYKAMRAGEAIRAELRVLLKQRKEELLEKKKLEESSSEDLLSHLLSKPNGDGVFLPEEEIINYMISLVFTGHDTTTCLLTLIIKHLAELPHVRHKVLAEQREIAAAKREGESLQWDEIQRMKYSWNVICEVMRMTPTVTGSYRTVMEDFTFDGYTIPKGYKIFWCASFTHKDETSHETPTTFDESRYEGNCRPPPFSFVPFGGGPRMCLGKEFARLEVLVFLHYFVRSFDWELSNPNEKVIIDPLPMPINGLPVILRPRH